MLLGGGRRHRRGGKNRAPGGLVGSPVARRYLLGALLSDGLAGRFIWAGAVAGGICGRAGAAPGVIPWAAVACGGTSRMPRGAAGGEGCVVLGRGDVPA